MYLTTYHGRIDTGKRLLPVVPRRYGRAVHAMMAERRRPRSVRTIEFCRKQRGGPHGKGLRSRDFVEDALRAHLVAAHTRRAPFPLRLETVTGDRPPNVDFCDRGALLLTAAEQCSTRSGRLVRCDGAECDASALHPPDADRGNGVEDTGRLGGEDRHVPRPWMARHTRCGVAGQSKWSMP